MTKLYSRFNLKSTIRQTARRPRRTTQGPPWKRKRRKGENYAAQKIPSFDEDPGVCPDPRSRIPCICVRKRRRRGEGHSCPGKSLANTYPAYTDIDWQISLAEDATATVTLPTNLTENELAAAMDAGLSLSLDRDTQRGYLNPEKFPNPYQGGPLDSWKTQRDTQMF
ncbi:MAG: hypothetical protein ACLR5H_10465 [Oscillospiraceae bacterium]